MEDEVRVELPKEKPAAFKGTIGFSVNKAEFEGLKAVYGVSKPQELGVVAKRLLLSRVKQVETEAKVVGSGPD